MNSREFARICNQYIKEARYIEMDWATLWYDGDRLINEFEASCKNEDRWYDCAIYSIHDSVGNIIYVGKSRGRIRMRLLDHRGFGDQFSDGKPSSTVGEYLAENRDSRWWKIRIYDLPHDLEQKSIYLYNGYFNDDHKPKKASIDPVPAPSFEVVANRDNKRQAALNRRAIKHRNYRQLV